MMDFDGREKKRYRRRNIVIGFWFVLLIIIIILWATGFMTTENFNVPEVPPKPELQLEWDEFK